MPISEKIFPLDGVDRLVFLKNIVSHPQIEIGAYTYYDDPDDVNNFLKNVLYLFDFIGDRLKIGKFCQIASGTTFIMNGAAHPMALSTYPFHILGHAFPNPPENVRDTVVGNDVWIGLRATVLPGLTIGDGAIIGACSMVTKDVEPYTIVAGNPARVIRKRFDDDTIARLLDLRWWDWPLKKIRLHLEALSSSSFEKLQKS